MGSSTIPVLLVTANVGSIFEDPTEMLKIWTEEFLSTVSKLDPKFIALHCQEVGGKNYELSMKHVEHFVKLLMSSNELRLFDKIRVFLDEDYSSAEHFTALGNLYFVHHSLENILIWDFKNSVFLPVQGKEIHSGNIEAVLTKEKAKFPQDFFPECRWSRKGFMRTRWSLNGSVVDLVNIHLFHDASNFIAMEKYPSVYCKNRRRALQHTLQKFHNDIYERAPYFLFGDFNFRADTDGVVKKLTSGLKTTRIQNNKSNEYSKIQFSTEDSQLVLTIGKKEFNHLDHQTVFLNGLEWLKSFDKELEAFEDTLTEYPVTFNPSYPFEEKVSHPTSYMQTRCPSWCDRILLSKQAKQLVDEESTVDYGLIGFNTCMGDHKPVYLRLDLQQNAGTLVCCDHAPFACLPDKCRCCHAYASVEINVTDMSDYAAKAAHPRIPLDSKLLHEPITREMLAHDPYTPESVDSHLHSPLPVEEAERGSVSPAQLKSRLEGVLRDLKRSPDKNSSGSSPESGANNSPESSPESGAKNLPESSPESGAKKSPVRSPGSGAKKSSDRSPESGAKKSQGARLVSMWSLRRLHSHHSSSDEDWFGCRESGAKCSQEIAKDAKDVPICADERLSRAKKRRRLGKDVRCCVIV